MVLLWSILLCLLLASYRFLAWLFLWCLDGDDTSFQNICWSNSKHIPENRTLHNHLCKNCKSYIPCAGFAWYFRTFHKYIQKVQHFYLGDYYFIYQQPVLVCSDGKFKNFLASHVPILQEKYWPTFWCFESRLQTAFASLLRSVYPNVKYRRWVLCSFPLFCQNI